MNDGFGETLMLEGRAKKIWTPNPAVFQKRQLFNVFWVIVGAS